LHATAQIGSVETWKNRFIRERRRMALTLPREEAGRDIEMLKGRAATGSARLDSVDLVRGVVMVLMALDHVRDFTSSAALGPARFDPMDLDKTTPAYFLTRWVTHFCAPTFVFLAGTGAFLSGSRGKTTGQLSWFLLTRGLWLALLEVTVVHLSWTFNWDLHERGGAVIWAIGWSMVGLALLVWLPTSAVAAIGVSIMVFHNLLDGIRGPDLGSFERLWYLLHQPNHFEWWPERLQGYYFSTPYAVLAWLGTMAAGYGLGAMLLLQRGERRRQLLGLGLTLIVLFVCLRAFNQYGDPNHWKEAKERELAVLPGLTIGPEAGRRVLTAFSFLDCTKYPPSLLFLLMTLGPSITALALFDRPIGWLGKPFVVFGRVPLFYYLLHLPLIHGVAVAIDYYRFGWSPISGDSIWTLKPEEFPPEYGVSLPMVYAIWAAVVLFLFPLCYGFMLLKRRYPGGILSYL
jgi:uncharacterized membrane protein